MQKLKYFGHNRMAAMQDENVASHNKGLVKYRPEWGLGAKGTMGSHNEGWNPTMGMKASSEMMIDVEPETKMYHGQTKKIPFMQAAGMYWDGSGMKQMDPGSMMGGSSRSKSSVSAAGSAAGPDIAKEKESSEMMKGFKLLHKNSPELQKIVEVADWDDMSPNAIRGIMGGLDMMGKAEGLQDKANVRDSKLTEQSALAAAAENAGDPVEMMKAYTGAGGSEIDSVKSMQAALKSNEEWKPSFGKEDGKEYMMTSKNSAQLLSKKPKDLKVPYEGPVIERGGVTMVWNDKDGIYKPFRVGGDNWVQQLAGELPSRDEKTVAKKSGAARKVGDKDGLWK